MVRINIFRLTEPSLKVLQIVRLYQLSTFRNSTICGNNDVFMHILINIHQTRVM